MGKYLSLLVLLMAMGQRPPTGPGAGEQEWRTGNLVSQRQPNNVWCAVASARMLMSKQRSQLPSQCAMVSRVVGEDCCKRQSLKCNKEQRAEAVFSAYGLPHTADYVPSFNKVVASIKRGNPVAIYHYQGEAGHSVVAYWAFVNKGKTYIGVYDPWTDNTKVWDASYVTGGLRWYGIISLK
jgi:Papain-like cysteine protease AvrRpt2